MEYKLLLTNTLYNLLMFSFPKQYYTAQLTYVIKYMHITYIM